jgi:hypothetical protein
MSADEYAAEREALSTVQRRVVSIGFAAITMHGVIGLVFVAEHMQNVGRTADAILMLVMSAFASVVTVAVVRVILAKSPWSIPWHLACLAIPVIGAIWTFS